MYDVYRNINLLNSNIYDQQMFNARQRAPQPYPPYLANIQINEVSATHPAPKWRDDKGCLYGTVGSEVYKSTDEGDTWSSVLTASGEIQALLVSNTGRIIVSLTNGLYVSDESQTALGVEPAATFLAGYVFEEFGQSMHDNYIAVSTYGTKGGSPPRQAFLSVDYGATWAEIYQETIENMSNPADYHIHDIEYDPYSGRIWLMIGDGDNRDLKYSDDLGVTWSSAYSTPGEIVNITSLMASPFGLLLGSDSSPPSIYIIRSTYTNSIRFSIPSQKLEQLIKLGNIGITTHYATRGWVCKKLGIYLMPFFGNLGTNEALLLGSGDGLHWFHLYRHPVASKFLNIVGPDEKADVSTQKYVHALLQIGTTKYNFKAEMPTFK